MIESHFISITDQQQGEFAYLLSVKLCMKKLFGKILSHLSEKSLSVFWGDKSLFFSS